MREQRELTAEESRQLQAWLDNSPSNKESEEELKKLYFSAVKAKQYKHIDVAGAWEKVKIRTSDKRPKRVARIWAHPAYRIAAVFLPVLLIASLFWLLRTDNGSFENIRAGSSKAILELADGYSIEISPDAPGVVLNDKGVRVGICRENTFRCLPVHSISGQMNTLIVPIGAEYRLILCDGTSITVNSGSKIRYPYAFSENERRIELEGEAYFDVAKDPAKPFIVKSRFSEVRVLGTHFNFSSYADDHFEHVTLEEGKVLVKRNGQEYSLTPGEQYYLEKNTAQASIGVVDTYLYTSWRNGQFRFQDLPLSELTTKISRWYDVNFVFEDVSARNLRFTGAFERTGNLKDFVDIIESTTKVHFELKGKTIIVSRK